MQTKKQLDQQHSIADKSHANIGLKEPWKETGTVPSQQVGTFTN